MQIGEYAFSFHMMMKNCALSWFLENKILSVENVENIVDDAPLWQALGPIHLHWKSALQTHISSYGYGHLVCAYRDCTLLRRLKCLKMQFISHLR